ncbi:MAG: hypothetical protein DWQ02_20905 [Bacteroidetes bacterium]|nr:MAG: hypothetical protein DWQ02_20905 [Bacteroidota bacterium]
MKKFRILIFDDESSIGESDGSARVVNFLQHKHFIRRDIQGSCSLDNFMLEDCTNVDIEIWGGATLVSFDSILKILKQRGAEEMNKNYDIFFIDLKWEPFDINAKSEYLRDIKWESLAWDQETGNKSISKYIAGLEIMRLLGPSDKLKIVFSGAQENLLIKYLLKNYFWNRMSTEDLLIGNIGNDDYFKLIEDKIEALLIKQQNRVINQLSFETIEKLEKRIQEGVDLDVADIPHYENSQTEFWSIQSLFPKLWVQLTTFLIESSKEKARQDMLNALIPFPVLLSDVTAPYSLDRTFTAHDFFKKLNLLCVKEFVVPARYNRELEFFPIKKFVEGFARKPEASKDWVTRKFTDRLVNGNWSFVKKMEGPKYRIKEEMKRWLQNAGIYPGHLDYIYQVADYNAKLRGQEIILVDAFEERDNFVFQFQMQSQKNEGYKGRFGQFKTQVERTELNLELKGIYADGLGEILKIACYFYKGIFWIKSKYHQVKCTFCEDKKKIETKSVSVHITQIPPTGIFYEIIIPQI